MAPADAERDVDWHEQVDARRRELGLSVASLARAVGTSKATVHRTVTGRTTPPRDLAERIEQFLLLDHAPTPSQWVHHATSGDWGDWPNSRWSQPDVERLEPVVDDPMAAMPRPAPGVVELLKAEVGQARATASTVADALDQLLRSGELDPRSARELSAASKALRRDVVQALEPAGPATTSR